MDSNAYAMPYHEPGDYDMAPALSFGGNHDWSLMTEQPLEPPGTEAQSLDVYQTASLGPSSRLMQHAPLGLQEALTRQRSETLDDSYIINGQSGHFQEDVITQIDRTPYPNEDDWEQHKPKIIDLYRKMPLKDLMATMKRDHSFKASAKMYKDRIRKWQIDKKIKSHEMKAMICKQAQRSRVGKRSLFHLRNSEVPEHKINRFRKSMKLMSEEQALMLRAETPPGLICYTPPASPLTTPEILEIPERIAKLVQDYIEGALESGTWRITSKYENVVSAKGSQDYIQRLYGEVCSAVEYFQRGETCYALRTLRIAMARVEHVVSAEAPSTLEILAFLLLKTIGSPNTSGVTFILLKQFSAMSALILPKKHPFNQIFAHLIRLDMSHLRYTLIMANKSQLDRFSRSLGRFSWRTLCIELALLTWKSLDGVANTTEAHLTLLQATELVFDASDPRVLLIKRQLASHYLLKGNFVEAAEIAQRVVDQFVQIRPAPPNAIYQLSCAQYKLSMTTLAEQNLRHAIHNGANICGWEDGRVLEWMSHLEDWLEEWERPDEAAEVRWHRHEILASMEERITREEERRCQRLGITGA